MIPQQVEGTVPQPVLELRPWRGPGGDCAVYVQAWPGGGLLYIGSAYRAGSDRPELARFAEHQRRGSGGWLVCDDPARWVVWRGRDRLEMARVERALIAVHAPPCNIEGVPGRRAQVAGRPAPARRDGPVRVWRGRVRRVRRLVRTVRRVVRWVRRAIVVAVVLLLVAWVAVGMLVR